MKIDYLLNSIWSKLCAGMMLRVNKYENAKLKVDTDDTDVRHMYRMMSYCLLPVQ